MIERALGWVFSTDPFLPHGFCLLWRPDLVWSHVLADGAIALSYFSIPLFLVSLARSRRDLLFTWPLYLCKRMLTPTLRFGAFGCEVAG